MIDSALFICIIYAITDFAFEIVNYYRLLRIYEELKGVVGCKNYIIFFF
jgi:hypothetical protein